MEVQNVLSVTLRNQWNICLFPVLLLGLFGGWFLLHITFHLHPMSQICLGIGLMELTKLIKLGFALVFRLYVDQFVITEMILFLIERTLLIFCRLSTLWSTGSSYGVSCSRRTSESAWFLDATAFEWLPMIFSTRLLGGLLRDYMMPRLLSSFLFFRWLIFVSTLVDR
jgi:hypothetical protein